jgi:sugar O-acyltransferase (sialic acid O-acetyltransferase NeuD family)
MKKKKLIIVGDSAFAEIAREYFDVDTDYQVVAFAVEEAYLKQNELHGLPVVAFERLPALYAPQEHDVFAAVTYTGLNRLRERFVREAKTKGYRLASYVSPRAFVWRNVRIGEHVFIFEDNTVQPFVELGNNVVLWSGNHVGHHSKLRDNIFVSSQVVISGYCDIGENSFLGVNASIANNVTVARDNWVGPGVTLMRDTEPGNLFKAEQFEPAKVSATRFFKVQ